MNELLCLSTAMPFDVCQRSVVEAANELIGRDRRFRAICALTAPDVGELPNGDVTVIFRFVDDEAGALRIKTQDLVGGEQFLKNVVTVKLIEWLRDSRPMKRQRKTKAKFGIDPRRNRRDMSKR